MIKKCQHLQNLLFQNLYRLNDVNSRNRYLGQMVRWNWNYNIDRKWFILVTFYYNTYKISTVFFLLLLRRECISISPHLTDR